MVNPTDYRDDGMPLGGTGASGIGREGVGAAMLEMTEPKTVVFSGVGRVDLG